MTGFEVIDIIAREKRVERMVVSITHSELSPELKDLSQMIYIALMKYTDDVLVTMYRKGELNFFIARIILNQYRTNNSLFRRTYHNKRQILMDTNELARIFAKLTEDE